MIIKQERGKPTMICCVIVNFNDYESTIECVRSICRYDIIDHIIVVDNCSTNDSYNQLQVLIGPKVDLIKSKHNGGYGSGNNIGIVFAKEKYDPQFIIISNPDVIISEKAIVECYNFLVLNNNASVVAPLMLDKNRKKCYECVWNIPTYYQYLLFPLFLLGRIFHLERPSLKQLSSKKPIKCGCVAGSWLMIRTDDFIKIGMYDEKIFLYCEETVLGIKLHNNKKECYLLPYVFFVHNHSVSISKTIRSEYKQQKIMWKSRLYVLDNYFNMSLFYIIISRVISFIALFEWCIRKKIKSYKR